MKKIITVLFLVIVSILPLLFIPAVLFIGGLSMVATMFMGGGPFGLLFPAIVVGVLVIASMRLSKLSFNFYKTINNNTEITSFGDTTHAFFKFIEPEMKWSGIFLRILFATVLLGFFFLSITYPNVDSFLGAIQGFTTPIALAIITACLIAKFFDRKNKKYTQVTNLFLFIGVMLFIFL